MKYRYIVYLSLESDYVDVDASGHEIAGGLLHLYSDEIKDSSFEIAVFKNWSHFTREEIKEE